MQTAPNSEGMNGFSAMPGVHEDVVRPLQHDAIEGIRFKMKYVREGFDI